jgi:hypothetical protein
MSFSPAICEGRQRASNRRSAPRPQIGYEIPALSDAFHGLAKAPSGDPPIRQWLKNAARVSVRKPIPASGNPAPKNSRCQAHRASTHFVFNQLHPILPCRFFFQFAILEIPQGCGKTRPGGRPGISPVGRGFIPGKPRKINEALASDVCFSRRLQRMNLMGCTIELGSSSARVSGRTGSSRQARIPPGNHVGPSHHAGKKSGFAKKTPVTPYGRRLCGQLQCSDGIRAPAAP